MSSVAVLGLGGKKLLNKICSGINNVRTFCYNLAT
jgi:hypothetical protein